ncbi:MAG: VOC family virulence protein [Proteobacteria bacterium]|nr:MAG: VOC family virulence protein [Pseudomonadota bacterium]
MFQIRDIDHIVLRVSDLERMVDFYCRALGCAVEWRRPDIGLVHLRAGSSLIDLVPVDGELGRRGGAAAQREGRNLDHFCLRIHPFDVESITTHLKTNGVEVGEIRERFGAEGEGTSIYLADPEGNGVELRAAKL